MAGLFGSYAVEFEKQGKPPVGFLTDRLYRHPAAFTDITVGNNGRWRAGSGIDPCTGLGVPDGKLLLTQLLGNLPAPPPVIPPPVIPPPVIPPPVVPPGHSTWHSPARPTDTFSVGYGP